MKKRRNILIVFIMVIILGSFFIPQFIEGMLPEVNVTKLNQIDYIDYVNATGQVEQKNKLQIVSEYPAIISEVLIKEGDTVKKGQPVLKIDREQTAKKAMESTSYATMAGVSTSDLFTSYQDAYDKIPEQIVSSVDGVVESVDISSGEFIQKDAAIASMVNPSDLVVTVKIPEKRIAKVAVGQPVEITGNGFEGTAYYGYVQSISPTARKTTLGTNQETVVEVTLSIENCDNKIKSGYSAKAKIATDKVRKINIIPYESIKQDKNGQEYVYIFNKGFAVRRNIKTGLEISDGIEVLSGLSSNDIIICQAQNIKGSGTLVKANK